MMVLLNIVTFNNSLCNIVFYWRDFLDISPFLLVLIFYKKSYELFKSLKLYGTCFSQTAHWIGFYLCV